MDFGNDASPENHTFPYLKLAIFPPFLATRIRPFSFVRVGTRIPPVPGDPFSGLSCSLVARLRCTLLCTPHSLMRSHRLRNLHCRLRRNAKGSATTNGRGRGRRWAREVGRGTHLHDRDSILTDSSAAQGKDGGHILLPRVRSCSESGSATTVTASTGPCGRQEVEGRPWYA